MIGTTVAGRYQIEEQIGIGGMGIVYRARDARLRRDVALKVIAPHLMQQEAERSRFLREAQALAGLTHPNIVTIFDMAEDEDTHTVFLVMELLAGHSLRHYLEEGSALSASDRPPFSHIALPLCRALEAAHGRGVLHRDIKPENIFICTDGTLKLMDFGLARLLGDMSKNQSSTVAGTLAYMAPEQLRGETLDARADLYALGIVFYEHLAGQQPFRADNPGALLLKHLTETPPYLRDLLPALPQEADALLTRMLAKEPDARFATAGEIRETLEASLLDGNSLVCAIDKIDKTALGNRTAGEGAKTLLSPLPALATQPMLPTQSTVKTPSVPQKPKSKIIHSRPVAVALAGVGVLAALLVGKTLAEKAETGSGRQTTTQSANVLPVSQNAPLAVSKITPPASATPVAPSSSSESSSAKLSKAETNSLVAKANSSEAQSAVSGGLPTPNTPPAPLNLTTPALTTQQIAELETLRREQQEELALLRSLRQQISEKSLPPAHTPSAPPVTKATVASGKPLPLSALKLPPVKRFTPSIADTDHTATAASKPSSDSHPMVAAQSGGTSQYEERRPLPALRLRAWRLPAPDDRNALHIGLQNSVDCNAYFYIIEDDKRRAVRAYPGPERFLTPQTLMPNEVRLPFSGDTTPDHQKAVLMIAAPHEITGLPATLSLPPAPSDKPPTGATPQQVRAFFGQAMHVFNDEIGQQLQQNHARFAGQPLHPHDIIVRLIGFNRNPNRIRNRDQNDPNRGPQNRRDGRFLGNRPEPTAK